VDCEDTANTLKYITPFQVQLTGQEIAEAMVHSTNNGFFPSDVNEWNHDESVDYIHKAPYEQAYARGR